jgi:LysR family glycine cleavage system transcriptional activator
MSFKSAAKELFVTPAALSQQVKLLEGALGLQLFKRLNRSIALTEAGHVLLPVLRESFQRIAETVERLRGRDHTAALTVTVLPSLAARWLIPRLGRFRERHPDIDVRISASLHLVDFQREDVDLGIRNGAGEWPGLHATRLFSEDPIVVCSPKLLRGKHALKTPADLRRVTLLHDESPNNWAVWLRVHGVTGVNTGRGPLFNDASHVLQAAVSGQGAALSPRAFAADDLERGTLVQAFDLHLPSAFGYYLVCPLETVDRPKVKAFREWLRDEVLLWEKGLAKVKHPAVGPKRQSRKAGRPGHKPKG